MKYATGILSIALALLLLILHTLASDYSWYWVYPWFDMVMHLLGGLSLGFLFVFMYSAFKPDLLNKTTSDKVWYIVIPVCAIVIAWEIFEYAYDVHNATQYVIDTGIDLLLGVGGSILGLMISQSFIRVNDQDDAGKTTL